MPTISENGIGRPDSAQLLQLSVRHWLKGMAYASSDEELWCDLVYFRFYDEHPDGLLKNVINYWEDAREDFVNFFDEAEGYFQLRRPGHQKILKEQQAVYVRTAAVRFLRLFDDDYFTQKMR